jgi:oligopeptide/dipeptide ABC transporter ATP-binding protein
MSDSSPLLAVDNLVKRFPIRRGVVLRREVGSVHAVDGVSFSLGANQTFGLVGESGCGKSTIARTVLLVERPTAGRVLFDGKDVHQLSGAELKWYRRSVQTVLQDPYSSLSPRLRVKEIIEEPMIVHGYLSRGERRKRVGELLEIVGLAGSGDLYPHQFSGGQRQRIAIARSLALNPRLLVLDEPVSALDVSIRAQILNLLRQIQQQFGVSYLLIAHDLAIVAHMSDTIGVMYLGELVEVAASDELSLNPLHPYSRALLSAALPADPDATGQEIVLTGEVPSPLHPPSGCRFRTRCPAAMPVCVETAPGWTEKAPGHRVACHLYG